MAVNTNLYASPTSQDTSRGPSSSIWSQFQQGDMTQTGAGGFFGGGVLIEDDFLPCPEPSAAAAIASFGKWASWGAAGTTIVDGVEEGGVMKINGTTANKSFILTSNAGGFRFIGPTSAFLLLKGKFAMEMRIALGSIAASQQGVFFGLADSTGGQINASDTTIVASGGNTLTTTKNLIGFMNRTTTSPADFSVVYQPAAGTAVYPTGLTTVVNDVTAANLTAYAASTIKGQGTGFVKLGMVYDSTASNPPVQTPASPPSGQTAGNVVQPLFKFYVNGQLHPKFLGAAIAQAATFPTNCLFSPVFNYMNIAGATAPVYLDWMRFAQVGTF